MKTVKAKIKGTNAIHEGCVCDDSFFVSVDHKLVVADTINEAVELYKAYIGKDYTDEPYSIQAISTDRVSDFNALIKEEE